MQNLFAAETEEYEPDITVLPTHKEIGYAAAAMVTSLLSRKPNAVLGLPTGGTPTPMYEELTRLHKKGLDFSKATFFNLDEYIGLPPEHPQSYHAYMRRNFFDHINASAENINIPDGIAADAEQECSRYENKIKEKGGIDLQLLGIGANGHLGFCEPGTKFTTKTHIALLADQTREDNARFFKTQQEVPARAISMGLGTIMAGRRLVLLASGAAKAEAVNGLLKNPITTETPATILRYHKQVQLLVDKEAFSSNTPHYHVKGPILS